MVRFRSSDITISEDVCGDAVITITAPLDVAAQFGDIRGEYDIEIKRHREKRSLNANALFWKMCGSLAEVTRVSDDEMYLWLLARYGVKKYMVVRPEAVEFTKTLFRAAEEMGSVYVDGQRGVQLKCTIGSSYYDTKQMARLIDGTMSECKEVGAWVPEQYDITACLTAWEKERENDER